MDKNQRMEELIGLLNEASAAYYGDRDEIMSNYEWDALFDELAALEKETGVVLPDSPTHKTGADGGETGRRERHEFPALSLAKTKDPAALQKWAGDRPVWLSWKLDGLTLVATYDDGRLTRLMTRGNGTVGNNITFLAPYITGIPARVDCAGHLVVRGEAVISYTDFNHLNDTIEDETLWYANPRNLVSGTLNLDETRAAEVRERRVAFRAFTLVHIDAPLNSWGERLDKLARLGFGVVERELTDSAGLPAAIERWTQRVRSGAVDLPVDGLVVTFDDTEYAASGSVTGHHATNAGLAFKWQDAVAETVLDHIEWSCAASTISPVAVFRPVQLEGTEVKRANLHNISEMKRLGIGADGVTELAVIKSNMIIPKCIRADGHGTTFAIPEKCPVCGAPTEIRTAGTATGAQTLHCTNPDCTAKQLKKYARFVEKAGMDIDGLSEKTILRFINEGFIADFADIYDIERHREKIVALDGFGEKSFANLAAAVAKSRRVAPANFIYALSIPLVGGDAAKKIVAACGTAGFFQRLADGVGFEDVEGIGPERSASCLNWYADERNRATLERLRRQVDVALVEPTAAGGGKCAGLVFVVTGAVYQYKNRDELKAYVEAEGGKVTGSVSAKTDYLINNDTASASGKNQKAKALGVPIISEAQFKEMFG